MGARRFFALVVEALDRVQGKLGLGAVVASWSVGRFLHCVSTGVVTPVEMTKWEVVGGRGGYLLDY